MMKIVIQLKHDNDDNVDIFQENDKSTVEVDGVATVKSIADFPKKEQRGIHQRHMDTFMKDNDQFIRVGEVYGKITPKDQIIIVSGSCYYNNRKKASYAHE